MFSVSRNIVEMNTDSLFFKNLVLDILIDFNKQSVWHQAGIVDALEDFIDEWKCKHQLSRRKLNKRWKLQLTVVDDSYNKMLPQVVIERLKEEECHEREEEEEDNVYPNALLGEYLSLMNSTDANREVVLVDSPRTNVEFLELNDQKTVELLEETAAEVVASNLTRCKVENEVISNWNVEQCVNSLTTASDLVETRKGQNRQLNGDNHTLINDKRLHSDDDDDDVVDSDYYFKKKKKRLKKGHVKDQTPSRAIRSSKRKGCVKRREKEATMKRRVKETSDNNDDLPLKKKLIAKRKATDGENLEKKLTICEICGACVKTIKTHMMQHGDKLHKCPFCSYASYQKGTVETHIQRLHMNYRPHLCDICGKGFVKNSLLKEHVVVKHQAKRERLFICPECKFSTYTRSLLNTHHKNVHKPRYHVYKCELCDATVRRAGALKEHMKMCHTNERPFPCSMCDFHAKSAKRLKSHMIFHNEKTFRCETCAKMFFTRPQLRRHQVVHTRTTDFSCPFCSYKCNLRENLRKHCRSIHKQTYPPMTRINYQLKLEKKNAIDCISPSVNQITPVLFTNPLSC